MKFKNSGIVNLYYAISISLGTLIVSAGIGYFWFNGAINVNNISSIIEAQSLTQELEKRNEIDKIIELVSKDQVREGVTLADDLEKNIIEINELHSVDETYKALTNETLNHKNAINALISYPKLETIYQILIKKADAFFDFVKDNNWKTLTRTSRKLVAIIDNEKRNGNLDHKKISSLHWRLNQDINYMNNITKGSVLSEVDKNKIIDKLASLESEMKMLKKFSKDLKEYENNFFHFKNNYDAWLKDIKTSLSLKRLEGQQDSKKLILFLIGSVTYFFLVLIFGFVVQKKNKIRGQKENETLFINMINYDLMNRDEKNFDEFSDQFKKEFHKFKSYLDKRIKFGTFFQEALPIPAILLDSDLQLVWANSHFYRQWELEGQKGKENISWDYLQKFTNLGEEDPVITGFQNNIAGIYQIQIRTSPNKDLIPFEMYVSPIKDQDSTKVMIFFYPLKFMEETLHNQSKTQLGPITKTLDLFLKGSFTSESKEKVKKDFEIADIEGIYNKFEELNQMFNLQKDGLFKEIENLENDLYDKIKLLQDTQKLVERGILIQKTGFQKFSELKHSVVEVVDTRQEMEQVYLSTVVNSKELFQGKDELLKLVELIKEKVQQQKAIFDRLISHQKDFKEEKELILNQRNKIYQALNQTLQFKKSSNVEEQLKDSLENLKVEIKGVDKIIESINKYAKTLDVLISKSELLSNSGETEDMNYHELLRALQDKVETDIFNLSKLTKKGHENDEHMVQNLKNVYESLINNHKRMMEAVQLIRDEKITFEEKAGTLEA